jgi:hypothetical protein
MKCYQVIARFKFHHHKTALVSTLVREKDVPAFLVKSGFLFGTILRHIRYFRHKGEAKGYVAHLERVYKGRKISDPAISGGQGWLFPDEN